MRPGSSGPQRRVSGEGPIPAVLHPAAPVRHCLATLFFLAVCCIVVGIIPVSSTEARVKGKCKDCHAMHAETPSPSLTRGGCLECHGRNFEGDQNILRIGRSRIPQVIHKMPDGDLASGNFFYVADGYNPGYASYAKGHNVVGISRQEDPPMNIPPGFIRSVIIPGGIGPAEWPPQQQLTCAGTYGCHGNRMIEDPIESIYGAHHADDSVIDGSTVGKSYRFLFGIRGKEHQDWEYWATTDDHNGYRGDPNHVATDTISYLCGECHARYHPNQNLGGMVSVGSSETVWRRHPSDISLSCVCSGQPRGGEFSKYTVYSIDVPVGYIEPTGKEQIVNFDSIVLCLSCHRSHASPYRDMLRWEYQLMRTGAGELVGGCMTCHTNK